VAPIRLVTMMVRSPEAMTTESAAATPKPTTLLSEVRETGPTHALTPIRPPTTTMKGMGQHEEEVGSRGERSRIKV
jgi:hypothetical protein